MALHMILGSNTTTLSVVVPGMMILCGDAVSLPVIVFAVIISVSFHAILPFHSVSMTERYPAFCVDIHLGIRLNIHFPGKMVQYRQ